MADPSTLPHPPAALAPVTHLPLPHPPPPLGSYAVLVGAFSGKR